MATSKRSGARTGPGKPTRTSAKAAAATVKSALAAGAAKVADAVTGARATAARASKGASRATVSGPARMPKSGVASADAPEAKLAGTQSLAAAMPHNANKPLEYGERAAMPQAGVTHEPRSPTVIASALTEANEAAKVGPPVVGENNNRGNLDRVRADSGGRELTTNQGITVADNQSSLKVGLRGPTLLEDFVLREKITHFDHERIPERVVHARGSGAHGYFESYESLAGITRASLFAEAGKRTPVFARFSTVAGERGSTDTARDVRGFAVKFYTDEGNWDLVGNNIPVFFIQDAIKFPDVVHAVKPEPHHQMPQASSAHDTFWDFVSLTPESTHMLLWQMSDRAIPRSYRMMQGFGVHTFRFVNDRGEARFVKFHWSPKLGTHALDWDEAVKISGADPDFHRRDLWEAIEAGAYPEYELAVQVFAQEDADHFSFDVLDPTKIVPEELVPLRPIGRMVLHRNPDNFFAETEQVAFCVSHVVPGIDVTDDPLLQGRLFSYLDTQLTRLGGPNFHEIPINAPLKEIHNNQRDGFHRQTINRGRVNYEPNSLAGGCPFQAGIRGYVSFPARVEGPKLRGKPESFADHYSQAQLFWESQSAVEKLHIIRAFRFELTRVQTGAVRERVVAQLANVSRELADAVAAGLGIATPAPLPKVLEREPEPEVRESPALSMLARPGDGSIAARRIAVVLAPGSDLRAAKEVHSALAAEGAVPRFVAARLGQVASADGETLEADVTIEAMPSVLFDALVVPGGASAADALASNGQAVEFIKDQYRHCKPMLMLGESSALLLRAGIPPKLPSGDADPGLLLAEAPDARAIAAFKEALAKHRMFARQTDPPLV